MRIEKVQKSRQTFRSVGICADGHASDMCALWDLRNPSVIPSVFYVGKALGEFVGDSGTIL
jgi:hypothetical protein